jgi:hypothetical protein
MPFQLSDDALQGLHDTNFNLTREGGLPFPAPVFYVVNGDVVYKTAEAPALFYGGWATDVAGLDQLVQAESRSYPSTDLVGIVTTNADGKDINIYTARHLIVAPVSIRSAWIDRVNNTRTPQYVEGSRQHVQALCVIGMKGEDGMLHPWGPAVLSAKGFQAKNLKEAFSDWEKHTALVRSKEANALPAWMFYCAIGTFGQERVSQMVGGNKGKSSITPISVHKPEATLALLEKVYGGEALANNIIEYGKQSQDWVKAWSEEQSTRGGTSAPGGKSGGNPSFGSGSKPSGSRPAPAERDIF